MNLQNVTISLAEFYLYKIEEMQNQDLVKSRSDAIRVALGLQLQADLPILLKSGIEINTFEFNAYNSKERIQSYQIDTFRPQLYRAGKDTGKKYLKTLTINLPVPYLAMCDEFEKIGLIPSRSEYIRIAVKSFIDKATNYE